LTGFGFVKLFSVSEWGAFVNA